MYDSSSCVVSTMAPPRLPSASLRMDDTSIKLVTAKHGYRTHDTAALLMFGVLTIIIIAAEYSTVGLRPSIFSAVSSDDRLVQHCLWLSFLSAILLYLAYAGALLLAWKMAEPHRAARIFCEYLEPFYGSLNGAFGILVWLLVAFCVQHPRHGAGNADIREVLAVEIVVWWVLCMFWNLYLRKVSSRYAGGSHDSAAAEPYASDDVAKRVAASLLRFSTQATLRPSVSLLMQVMSALLIAFTAMIALAPVLACLVFSIDHVVALPAAVEHWSLRLLYLIAVLFWFIWTANLCSAWCRVQTWAHASGLYFGAAHQDSPFSSASSCSSCFNGIPSMCCEALCKSLSLVWSPLYTPSMRPGLLFAVANRVSWKGGVALFQMTTRSSKEAAFMKPSHYVQIGLQKLGFVFITALHLVIYAIIVARIFLDGASEYDAMCKLVATLLVCEVPAMITIFHCSYMVIMPLIYTADTVLALSADIDVSYRQEQPIGDDSIGAVSVRRDICAWVQPHYEH